MLIFLGHQYETVSGFICESFGYIPEEGGKMIVVLEKANQEEASQYKNTESDHQDEKEKQQTFELEILEANERKVGKVWFKPISNESVDVGNKGINRLVSTKVVKRKRQSDKEQDRSNISETAERLEDGDAREVSIPDVLKKDLNCYVVDGKAEATPKAIMRTMGVKGLTLFHLKSHLQKYRLRKQSGKEMVEQSKDASYLLEPSSNSDLSPRVAASDVNECDSGPKIMMDSSHH